MWSKLSPSLPHRGRWNLGSQSEVEAIFNGKYHHKKRGGQKKLTLIYKETSSAELVSYLKPKLQDFVRHVFVAKCADEQFKNCLANFRDNTIV